MPTTTPTVSVQTTFHACTLCGARRRSAEMMDLHADTAHDGAEPSYTTKTSVYGQPASFPVPAGDRVVAKNRPEGDPCQALTPGCSIDHSVDTGTCEGW